MEHFFQICLEHEDATGDMVRIRTEGFGNYFHAAKAR